MTAQLITPLPTPPSRQNPVDFSDRTEAFLTAMQRMALEINAATPGDSAAGLAQYMADKESDTLGASLVGFSGAKNYVSRTIGQRLMDMGCSPRSLGGVGDGVADDTVHVRNCALYSKTIDLRNRTWKITGTIDLPSGCVVDMRGATIIADVGSTAPLFRFDAAKDGLLILGGFVTGTAHSFLMCQGTTYTPNTTGEYARQIRLQCVHVSSTTMQHFMLMDRAVRQVYVDSCMAYTINGVHADGKHVECYFHKCIIYSSTGAAGTFGIRLRSQGGGIKYNEGFEFFGCTIDNFATSLDVTDVFSLNIASGYIGSAPGGYAAVFGQPTTTLCSDIKFDSVALASRVRFAPSGGLDYAATFTGCTSLLCGGVNIQLANNAAGVSIRSHKFRASASGIAIEAVSNNAGIRISDIDCDNTFIGGVQIKGSAGANCSLSNMSYAGTGEPIYLERTIQLSSVPLLSAAGAAYKWGFNPSSIQGAKTVGSAIASVSSAWAKGETGWIVVELACTGMNAATQRFDIAGPIGMVFPNGTGWAGGSIHTNTTGGRVSARIPYYVTQDVTGALALVNAAGNTVTIDFHSFFGFERNW